MTAKVIPIKRSTPVFQKVLRRDGSAEPYLLLHAQTQFYYVRKYKAGKGELFKTTGQRSLGKAKTVRDELIAEFEGGRFVSTRKRVEDVADECQEALKRLGETLDDQGRPMRRKRTIDKDNTYFPIIKDFFGEEFVDAIDEAYWVKWQTTKGATLKRTVFDIGKYLSKTLTFACERKYILRKPKIDLPDQQTRKHKVYSDDQVRTFLKHSEPDLWDLIMIEATTGPRPHETTELRWEWIEFRKNAIVVRLPGWFTKTDAGREFQLGPLAAEVIRRRHKRRNPSSPFVFPATKDPSKPMSDVHRSRMWRRMLKRAGIKPGIKFHWLRHTFYNKALLEAREPIQHVSEYGGTSIATLQRNYLKSDAVRTASVASAVQIDLKRKNEK